MSNNELTPEQFQKAKKANQKKVVLGVLALIVIVVLVISYKVLQNMQANADSTGNIIATPKLDSDKVDAPQISDRSELYTAEREKARKDSESMYAKPKADAIMKMVSSPIINNNVGAASITKTNSISGATTPVFNSTPTITKRVAVNTSGVHNKHKSTIHHTIKASQPVTTLQPKQVASESVGFNFVYNSEKKASRPSSQQQEKVATSTATGNTASTVAGAGYSNYSTATHNTAAKPIEARLVATIKVEEGDAVAIKLLESLVLPDGTVPAGSIIYGKASISSNRVDISITNVQSDKGIIGCSLQVLGADMIDGIKANVKKPKVDASGVPSTAENMVTSQLGALGGLLGSVRSRSSSNADPEYYLEAGKKCYIKSN